MALTFRTTAIALGKRPVRETDRVYSVLTPEHGKLELLAKGSRKIVSKLAGEMETVGVLDLFVVRGRVFDRLAGAAVLAVYKNIYASLERTLAALSAAAFLDRAIKTHQRDPALFVLLRDYLQAIDAASSTTLAIAGLPSAFRWKIFAHLGFRPELARCVRCRRPARLEDELSVRHGGLICAGCSPAVSPTGRLAAPGDLRAALAFFIDAPLGDCGRPHLPPTLAQSVIALTATWSRMHLELEPF